MIRDSQFLGIDPAALIRCMERFEFEKAEDSSTKLPFTLQIPTAQSTVRRTAHPGSPETETAAAAARPAAAAAAPGGDGV